MPTFLAIASRALSLFTAYDILLFHIINGIQLMWVSGTVYAIMEGIQEMLSVALGHGQPMGN